MSNYISSHTGTQIDTCVNTYQNAQQVQAAIDAAKLAMFPVGSIYISTTETNPSTFIGGTWEKIEGKFLLGASEEFLLGSEGGTTTHSHTTQDHTLTINEMPSHQHATTNYNGGGNATGFVVANAGPHGDRNYWNFYNPGYSSYTGGSAPHNHGETTEVNILPPYLSVAIWQRIA